MKKLEKKAEDLFKSLKDDQQALLMFCTDDGDFMFSYSMNEKEIAEAVATILSDAFDDEKDGAMRVARGILRGLAMIISEGGKSSDVVMRTLTKVVTEDALSTLTKLIKKMEGVGEDDEDCEHCDYNRTCQLPSAIKYRKANGIPAPRKRGKNGKKRRDNGEEIGN